jgi:hypothetical protein
MPVSAEQLDEFYVLLNLISQLDVNSKDYESVERAVAHLTKTAKKRRQKNRAKAAAIKDAAAMKNPSSDVKLHHMRRCYVCDVQYRDLNEHLPQLCPKCANESLNERTLASDLTGRRARQSGLRHGPHSVASGRARARHIAIFG